MKFMKKSNVILIATTLMISALVLGACGGSKDGEVEYKVTVVDAIGNSYGSDVLVMFMQEGSQMAMQVCDENGVATKALAAGDYDIQLKMTDSDLTFTYEEGVTVSAKNPEAEIELSYTVNGDATTLGIGTKESDAYGVSVGCTSVELTAGERNYFLFTPTEAGTYEFSIADDADVTIGYYGAPHFVQDHSATEVVDNKFTVSVSDSMIGTGNTGTTVLVIGIDSEKAENCILSVERTGDPEHTLADEPWTIYEKTVELKDYVLPEGTNLVDFDITEKTDAYKLVFNEEDGYYHLNSADGPLVYVYLAEDPDYLPCFKNILDRSGVSKYFFDENDEFVKKESYSECLLEYIEYADEKSGVYPLTKDLEYIIKQRGEYVGWWDSTSPNFIFSDATGTSIDGLNTEIAWLFMCCYAE